MEPYEPLKIEIIVFDGADIITGSDTLGPEVPGKH